MKRRFVGYARHPCLFSISTLDHESWQDSSHLVGWLSGRCKIDSVVDVLLPYTYYVCQLRKRTSIDTHQHLWKRHCVLLQTNGPNQFSLIRPTEMSYSCKCKRVKNFAGTLSKCYAILTHIHMVETDRRKCTEKKEKSMLLGVMTGASVPRSSPRQMHTYTYNMLLSHEPRA